MVIHGTCIEKLADAASCLLTLGRMLKNRTVMVMDVSLLKSALIPNNPVLLCPLTQVRPRMGKLIEHHQHLEIEPRTRIGNRMPQATLALGDVAWQQVCRATQPGVSEVVLLHAKFQTGLDQKISPQLQPNLPRIFYPTLMNACHSRHLRTGQ